MHEIESLFAGRRASGVKVLPEPDCKAVLRKLGLSVPASRQITGTDQVPKAMEGLQTPLVLKVVSESVVHKSEYGGVMLKLQTQQDVQDGILSMKAKLAEKGVDADCWLLEEMVPSGIEMVVGAVRDPEFGPMVMVGFGGIFVEVNQDVAFRLCPIDRDDASQMIEELRGSPLLRGARGTKPANVEAIVDVLMQVGSEQGLMMKFAEAIEEIDLNPLIVNSEQAVAADARIIFRSA